MSVYTDGITFHTIICCSCSMPFGMESDYYDRRRKDHELFYCPAGHRQHFTGKSDEEKLREEVERQKQMREAEEARRLRVEQERDQVARAHTRMRTRVMNGVCPCCNRTFQNLMQHMKTEHAGEFNLRTLRTAFGLSQGALASEVGITQGLVSQHERGHAIPAHAKRAIDTWIARQTPTRSPS